MDKKYQVFISSTYVDLKEEREEITKVLLKAKCIPAGMEAFTASDQSQFEYIKKVIDLCDYYIVVVAGRYGSLDGDGISFTEKEYLYAKENGIHVIALVKQNLDEIPAKFLDTDPDKRKQLERFRNELATNRLIDYWDDPKELPAKVALCMLNAMNDAPAVGWVRADQISSAENLQEIIDLRNEVDRLTKALVSQSESVVIEDIADFEEQVTIRIEFERMSTRNDFIYDKTYSDQELSWREIFREISPTLAKHPHEDLLPSKFGELLYNGPRKDRRNFRCSSKTIDTIRIQFQALGLITAGRSETVGGGMGFFWQLTPTGTKQMFQDRSIKSTVDKSEISG